MEGNDKATELKVQSFLPSDNCRSVAPTLLSQGPHKSELDSRTPWKPLGHMQNDYQMKLAKLHPKSRWSPNSMALLQGTQVAIDNLLLPLANKLYIVKIL